MPRPRALLLDFYGTLVHEDTKVVDFICQEVSRSAPAASPSEVARTWWSAFSALARISYGPGFRLQRDLARVSLADTVSYHRSRADPAPLLEAQFAYWRHPQMHQDTRELLATTLPACVVSNIDRADLAAALAHHGLTGRFTHLITSQDARAYKPRPEMFTTALGLLGLGPHEVIHVGDSLTSDVAGAARLGIPVAWVNRDRRPAPGADPRPTYEVRDLSDLLVLLDGLAQDERARDPYRSPGRHWRAGRPSAGPGLHQDSAAPGAGKGAVSAGGSGHDHPRHPDGRIARTWKGVSRMSPVSTDWCRDPGLVERLGSAARAPSWRRSAKNAKPNGGAWTASPPGSPRSTTLPSSSPALTL